MIDVDLETNFRQQALLSIALTEAERQADELMPRAGESIENYQQWRAWTLIMKAVSQQIWSLMMQVGNTDDLGLYLSKVAATDYQFLALAEATVHNFYQDRLHVQDILMASAFDLARQAVKKTATELLGE
jgi:hypothetical protein